jgi:hypothetical protein
MGGELTKFDRGTIDMSRMAMLKRGLRLYHIRRGCYLVSSFQLSGRADEGKWELTSSSISCTPVISVLAHNAHIKDIPH